MIRAFFILFISFSFLNANNKTLQKQNILNIQNIIEIEESIARNYETYLLNEFKIPTLNDLKNNNYLGKSFYHINIFGDEIDFYKTNELKLKFAIKKAHYLDKDELGNDNYIIQFYKRDLYRDFTTVYIDAKDRESSTFINSYVEFRLKTAEAQNIYNILKNGDIIEKKDNCSSATSGNYCIENKNLNIIKYISGSDFIAYSLKDFELGDVTVSSVDKSFLDLNKTTKLQNLRVGAYIFGKNKRHIRLSDNIKEVK